MANIHTIGDFLENDRSPIISQQQNLNNVHDSFWSDNIRVDEIRPYHPICIQCGCGCCLGSLISDERKRDYLRLLKTFTFWISVIQIIYFVLSLCIDGFASSFFTPSNYALSLLGAKDAEKIKCHYQVRY
jgi:hypothetical protein